MLFVHNLNTAFTGDIITRTYGACKVVRGIN